MNLLLVLLGKLALFVSQTFNLGSGSTWPGHIAMETNSNFVRDVLKSNPNLKIVLIAGTNGKTTTSLMLQKILEEAKLKVFRNEAGANLLNGIASSIIKNSNILGNLVYDIAIFEVDENNLGEAIKQVSNVRSQLSIVLLNLFRDQLDRYGEVNTIAKKWDEALRKLPLSTVIFTNGDDPKLSDIANDSTLVRYYFGIEEKEMKSEKPGVDSDFTYCPDCQTKLKYSKTSYSHLGKFMCPGCGLTNPETETFPNLPHSLFGKYNIYNTNAAALVANKAFDVPIEKIKDALSDFKPAFGRQEVLKYKNREIIMLLSKNPAGFNQSIEAIKDLNKKGNILLILNDRIPDGRDVSWIWDVDFENLPKDSKIFITGDRAYDMGLRVKYASIIHNSEFIIQNLEEAIEEATSETSTGETLFILPTYSAMLEARKIITGKAIL
ncbi:MAG: hypothetical protein A2776_02955 [Candidatus Levybacteria bacterium RIFCSPHIGHO2_01_FULL_40_10]|nr:MAG: hypothetical protein A2776_02955 [Candidatus Levybacteria bacterium RIFCSPHIGHO2_01_FULL_40_10]